MQVIANEAIPKRVMDSQSAQIAALRVTVAVIARPANKVKGGK